MVDVGVIVLVLAAIAIAKWALRARTRVPHPGDIWFVRFPFQDDPRQSKDRPALIVDVTTYGVVARKITSQNKSRLLDQYDFLPRGASGLAKDSWISKQSHLIPKQYLRRRVSHH